MNYFRALKNWFLPTYANNYKAYLLTNKALLVYTVILILSNMFFTGASVNKTYALLDEQQIVQLHNRERSKAGLGTLKVNYSLSLSAKAKGQAMLAANCWSHYCPEGTSPWKYFRDVGYVYSYAGENLAEGFTNSDAMMQAWMNSKTHRENVLKAEFTEIGVAMVVGNFQGINNNTIVVVHFGRPKTQVKTSQTVTNGNTNTPSNGNTNGGSQPAPVPLKLTYPVNDTAIADNRPDVKGTYDKPLTVELSGKRSGRIIPNGGIFTYEPKDPLVDGEHSVRAVDYQNNNNATAYVNFTIDTASPKLEDNITLYDVRDSDDSLEYRFGLQSSEELKDFSLLGNRDLQNSVSLETLSTKVWSLNIIAPRRVSLDQHIETLTLVLVDLAGNNNEVKIGGDRLEQILQRDGSERVLGLRDLGSFDIFKQSLNANINRVFDLNIFEVISLVVLVVLLLLFIADYLVINHSELKSHYSVKSRASLHIPFIIIMIILVIMGNLGGGI